MRHVLLLLALSLDLAGTAAAELHHALEVSLVPQRHSLEARDRITLGKDSGASLVFALHPELQPELKDAGSRLIEMPSVSSRAAPQAGGVLPKRWRVTLPPGVDHFTLHYRGAIRHELQQQVELYARSSRQTEGLISPQGVFLAGSSYWYPRFDDDSVTFELALRLPSGWKGMSQGERTQQQQQGDAALERWRCDTPQQEIYLVAGPFTEYRDTEENVVAMVLLRQPDAALAKRYLDATHEYIRFYSDLIGPYAFDKFAMVENFWETGYGMPSFTLLGSKVLRFPFILHSSYPHEILHNWWGNGVYVDYDSGNWAEGLTSYLADHRISEQRGEGVVYRRTLLQKYADYVGAEEDFPLTSFRGRHDARSEAVGYGKTLMLFHMLRRQLGDETFTRGLRALYERYLFRVADFAAVQAVFSEVAEQPLDAFFAQWVDRRGAPQLRISEVQAALQDDRWRLTAVIEQTQPGDAYALRIPVAVQLEGQADAWQTEVVAREKREPLQLTLPARPLHVDVDPEFDLFRRLHRDEIPPSVSQAMGAERVLIVLPAQGAPELRRAYRVLAESWRNSRSSQVEIAGDSDLERLPDDRAVWLFGWNNRFRAQMQQALRNQDFRDLGTSVNIGQTRLNPASASVVVLARHPRRPENALGWLAADSAATVPGLGTRLPHYGRYSYLAFEGAQAQNRLKGQWPVTESPMSVPLVPGYRAPALERPLSEVPVAPRSAPLRSTSPPRLEPRRSLDRLGGRPVVPVRPQQD